MSRHTRAKAHQARQKAAQQAYLTDCFREVDLYAKRRERYLARLTELYNARQVKKT